MNKALLLLPFPVKSRSDSEMSSRLNANLILKNIESI